MRPTFQKASRERKKQQRVISGMLYCPSSPSAVPRSGFGVGYHGMVERYGGRFRCCPARLSVCARRERLRKRNHLVIGEYGESPRIAYVTPNACVVKRAPSPRSRGPAHPFHRDPWRFRRVPSVQRRQQEIPGPVGRQRRRARFVRRLKKSRRPERGISFPRRLTDCASPTSTRCWTAAFWP